jgi:hypothetical protein
MRQPAVAHLVAADAPSIQQGVSRWRNAESLTIMPALWFPALAHPRLGQVH